MSDQSVIKHSIYVYEIGSKSLQTENLPVLFNVYGFFAKVVSVKNSHIPL